MAKQNIVLFKDKWADITGIFLIFSEQTFLRKKEKKVGVGKMPTRSRGRGIIFLVIILLKLK